MLVYYKFKNEQKAGLGMPMPAGNVRVYQKDSKGGVLFIGEDRIDHTPKDETVTVHIGNAFDIVAERKQTDYKRIDGHTWEMEFEITLRNHKDAPVVVEVNEPIGGDWEMLSSTYKVDEDGGVRGAQFHVPVREGWDFGADVSDSGAVVIDLASRSSARMRWIPSKLRCANRNASQ